MNQDRPFKILFLCTGNSARSIFGEYFTRLLGRGKFESYSAWADPRAEVNPYTLHVLKEAYKIDASDARSKSRDEYQENKFDFVITVCDNARGAVPILAGTTDHRALVVPRSGNLGGLTRRRTDISASIATDFSEGRSFLQSSIRRASSTALYRLAFTYSGHFNRCDAR